MVSNVTPVTPSSTISATAPQRSAERFTGLQWIDERAGATEQADFLRLRDFPGVNDLTAIDERRHLLTIVVVLRGRDEQAIAGPPRHVDRRQDSLPFREPSEEQQVILGFRAEGVRICLDRVVDDAHDVEPGERVGLGLRHRDERGARVP